MSVEPRSHILRTISNGIGLRTDWTRERKPREIQGERLPSVLVVTPIYPWPGNPAEGIFVHRQVRNLAQLEHPVRVLPSPPPVPGFPPPPVNMSWGRSPPRGLVQDR